MLFRSYPEAKYRFLPDFPALKELCRKQKANNGHVIVIAPLEKLHYFEEAMPQPERRWISRPGMKTGYAILLY